MTASQDDAPTRLLSPSRLANDIVRRCRLNRDAKLLDVGCGPGDLVAAIRRRGVTAFGVSDGAAPPRDPWMVPVDREPPEIQPAALHQSLPFPAHWFDCILVRDSQAYCGSLTGPEACTATANLLACLKPGRSMICAGAISPADWEQHLAPFPGECRCIKLGTAGIRGLLRRLLAPGTAPAALQWTIPPDPISRLEWHRLAREAVMAAQRPAA